MIFKLFDNIYTKFNNQDRNKKPNKIKYIIVWLCLITLVTVIFHSFGLFKSYNSSTYFNYVPRIKSNKVVGGYNNSFRNNNNYERIDKNILNVVPKYNIKAIDSILNDVKNIPVPNTIKFDEYNFE